MKKLPRVVLVGRTNVGKSTLFNRLAENVKSIALDQVGVTRDFIQDTVCWNNACFTLIDTGGIQVKKTHDPIYKRVTEGVFSLLESADIILFMVDGAVGIIPEDLELTKVLHKVGKPVILVVNKGDVPETQENRYVFDRLGFKQSMLISASHGHEVAELLDEVVEMLPRKVPQEEIEKPLKVAIIGKPNAGKSSLLNALINEERAIVSDVPGTTREPITERVTFYQEDMELTDTPGVRRKRGVSEQLEKIMVKRAFSELKDADVVLLVVDASQGRLSDQELKLAFYAFEHHKALIVLFNKYDLVDEHTERELEFNLAPYEYLLDKIKTIRISCKSGKNIGKVLSIIKAVADRYKQTFDNDELTILFKDALFKRELFHQGQRLIVNKVKQIKTAPITLVLFVNEPSWFGPSQLGYFDNVMRKAYDLEGVPIKFISRANSPKKKKR